MLSAQVDMGIARGQDLRDEARHAFVVPGAGRGIEGAQNGGRGRRVERDRGRTKDNRTSSSSRTSSSNSTSISITSSSNSISLGSCRSATVVAVVVIKTECCSNGTPERTRLQRQGKRIQILDRS